MKAKITASGLNLRSKPDIGNNVVTILKKSNELDILLPDVNGWTMQEAGLSFKDEYTKALSSFDGMDFDDTAKKYQALQEVLQAILDRYSQTKPTTKAGSIFRKIGLILSKILPFIKFKK